MPSPPRQYHKGYWYHVYARGQEEVPLFTSRDEREWFIEKLDEVFHRRGVELGGLCLMATHYHALVRMGPVSLDRALQGLHTAYAKYVNPRRNREGALFRREPGADIVLEDSYLLQLVPYLHFNPVEEGIVSDPRDYEWHTDALYRTGHWGHGPLESWLFPPHFDADDRRSVYEERMEESVEYPEGGAGYIGDEETWNQLEKRDEERRDRFSDRRERPTMEQIAQAEADDGGTTVEDLQEPGRGQPEARIRQKAMVRMYQAGYGPTEIGDYFHRNKGTVMYAVDQHKEQEEE